MHPLLAGYRVGSVPYLNGLPLTAGMGPELSLLPPSQLADELRADRMDVALVSSAEVLLSEKLKAFDRYGILSDGPVFSVFLAHRTPLEHLRTIHIDTASRTSVNLLKVLLADRGIHPEFRPLVGYDQAASLDDLLLIGNPAIEFRRNPHKHAIWDLGSAWKNLTGLPFLYALWAFRDGIETQPLLRGLNEVAESGLSRLSELASQETIFDEDFRRQYLGGHIRYRIDDAARTSLEEFGRLLGRLGEHRVHPVRWVSLQGQGIT